MVPEWMVLHVCNGREIDVKWAIDDMHKRLGDSRCQIFETLAPVREVAVHSKKDIKIEPVIKGYVFVKCNMTNHLWHYLKSIPYVIKVIKGFIPEEEMQRIMPYFTKLAELTMPDQNYLDRIKKKYKDLIETKRNKKSVLRLPLKMYRDLIKTLRILCSGRITDRKIFRMLIESP
ncbi:MAG: transcription termination/antitermination NusG family protein [Bacillota bacterium]